LAEVEEVEDAEVEDAEEGDKGDDAGVIRGEEEEEGTTRGGNWEGLEVILGTSICVLRRDKHWKQALIILLFLFCCFLYSIIFYI
jgi:hypothetical protein